MGFKATIPEGWKLDEKWWGLQGGNISFTSPDFQAQSGDLFKGCLIEIGIADYGKYEVLEVKTIKDFIKRISEWLSPGAFLYTLLYAGLTVFFCYFYAAITFNPDNVADDLLFYHQDGITHLLGMMANSIPLSSMITILPSERPFLSTQSVGRVVANKYSLSSSIQHIIASSVVVIISCYQSYRY